MFGSWFLLLGVFVAGGMRWDVFLLLRGESEIVRRMRDIESDLNWTISLSLLLLLTLVTYTKDKDLQK